jgi:hypothetical protein
MKIEELGSKIEKNIRFQMSSVICLADDQRNLAIIVEIEIKVICLQQICKPTS